MKTEDFSFGIFGISSSHLSLTRSHWVELRHEEDTRARETRRRVSVTKSAHCLCVRVCIAVSFTILPLGGTRAGDVQILHSSFKC